MFQTLSYFIRSALVAVAVVFLILLVSGLGSRIGIDMQSAALLVAALLAVLILIQPYVARRAFSERLATEFKKLTKPKA